MWIKSPDDCDEIIANDGCRLRELVHPDRDALPVTYSLAIASVDAGAATAPHRLLGENELYMILQGHGRVHVDEEARDVEAGDCVMAPRGCVQWIENRSADTLRFTCLVTPPWNAEHDIRVDVES